MGQACIELIAAQEASRGATNQHGLRIPIKTAAEALPPVEPETPPEAAEEESAA